MFNLNSRVQTPNIYSLSLSSSLVPPQPLPFAPKLKLQQNTKKYAHQSDPNFKVNKVYPEHYSNYLQKDEDIISKVNILHKAKEEDNLDGNVAEKWKGRENKLVEEIIWNCGEGRKEKLKISCVHDKIKTKEDLKAIIVEGMKKSGK